MTKPDIPKMAATAVDPTRSLMIMSYNHFESQLYKEFAKIVVAEAVKFLQDSGLPKDQALMELEKRYET